MTQRHEKKEKVIHTRISEALEQELKTRASGLGVSVSNLVRNVLVSTFASARPAESMAGETQVAHAHGVIGWHPLLLAVNTVCTDCNAVLPRGSDAAIGITARPGEARPVVCLRCFDERRSTRVPEA